MKTAYFICGVLASCLSLNAYAESRLDRIERTKTITIGHHESSIPFSYLVNGKPVGYSMDLCQGVIDAVKQKLNTDLKVKLLLVSSANRIPLIMNGTVDLVCDSDTNNSERQQQVSFSPTIFVSALRFVSKKTTTSLIFKA